MRCFVTPSIFFPLKLAINLGDFWLFKPLMQALNTFIGFDDPMDFATISLIPITSHAALIGPPAIIPVPEGADLIKLFQLHPWL